MEEMEMNNGLLDGHQAMVAEQARVYEFLQTHKIAISFKWRHRKYGFYGSHEEANAAWVETLRAEGYKPRKWWQISRWGEETPPKEVLAALKA